MIDACEMAKCPNSAYHFILTGCVGMHVEVRQACTYHYKHYRDCVHLGLCSHSLCPRAGCLEIVLVHDYLFGVR